MKFVIQLSDLVDLDTSRHLVSDFFFLLIGIEGAHLIFSNLSSLLIRRRLNARFATKSFAVSAAENFQ
jgi:hypothetical protein